MSRILPLVCVIALGCGGEGDGDTGDTDATVATDPTTPTSDSEDPGDESDDPSEETDTQADPCADSLGTTSEQLPFSVASGTPVKGAATDGWDVFTFDRSTDGSLFTVELQTEGDVILERRERWTGGWVEVDADEFGELPDGTQTLWKGWYEGVGSPDFFDTAVYDTDPTPVETIRLRVKAADDSECIAYTLETKLDTGYDCDPDNDTSEYLAGGSARLPDGASVGIFDSADPGETEFDHFKDTIPAGKARQYVVRTIRDSARFGLRDASGLAYNGTSVSLEASPLVVSGGNTGTEALDVWFYAQTLYGTPECLPYFVEVSTVPLP